MTVTAFPKPMAKTIVRQVNAHVNAMIGPSQLLNGSARWSDRNDRLGLLEKREVQLGTLLGSGGFSDVYEVTKFDLKRSFSQRYSKTQVQSRNSLSANATDKATGQQKYVVKHLRSKTTMNTRDFCMAAADLVVEAQFLSVLDHENIIGIHGWSSGGVSSFADGHYDGYFLILDKLDETLDSRIASWKKGKFDLSRSCGKMDLTDQQIMPQYVQTRVAREIASALQYLHSNNIVFRDLKPDNIGFKNGAVKLFDFGLARELPEKCTNGNDVFRMSGKIGTVRYMAPEVALSQDYNQKVDTYSWAMVFWQCLALEKPYAAMTRGLHASLVCREGQRPDLYAEWPQSIKKLLERSWSHDMTMRCSMIEVVAYLERIERQLKHSLVGKAQLERRVSWVCRPSTGIVSSRRVSNTLVPMAA